MFKVEHTNVRKRLYDVHIYFMKSECFLNKEMERFHWKLGRFFGNYK